MVIVMILEFEDGVRGHHLLQKRLRRSNLFLKRRLPTFSFSLIFAALLRQLPSIIIIISIIIISRFSLIAR